MLVHVQGMCVANALGSNVFDLCFALGLPWLVYGLIYGMVWYMVWYGMVWYVMVWYVMGWHVAV